MRHATTILFALFFIAAAASRSSGQTTCPSSTFAGGSWNISTTQAVFDTTCPVQPSFNGRVRGHFDLTTDQLGLNVAQPSGYLDVHGHLRVADRHRLVGLPAGTPVSFSIRLSTAASVIAFGSDFPTWASGTARIEVDGNLVAEATQRRSCDGDEFFPTCTTTGDVATVTANLIIEAEREFQLTADLRGGISLGGSHSVGLESTLHFDGLPPGVTVVSCHDAPVPVRATTWGTLKTRYR